MTTQTITTRQAPPPIPVIEHADSPASKTPAKSDALRRLFAMARMALFGPLFCFLSALTSIAVVGWTFRFSQRIALKHWYKRSPQYRKGERFQDAAERLPALATNAHFPNWVLPQKSPGLKQQWFRWSLFQNLWIGLKGFSTALVLLALPGFAMMFAWWGGWENSFGKGYEQAPVGAVTSLLAMFVAVALMFYIPIAHARQAISGRARDFFDFKKVMAIISQKWYWVLSLTVGFGILSVPIFAADAFLGLATAGDFPMADYTPPQALTFLNSYFFGWCAYLFIAYVFLHWVAAWVYASGVLARVKSGRTTFDQLSPFERSVFEELEINASDHPAAHPVVKGSLFGVRLMGTVATLAASAMIWLSIASETYVAEFFNSKPMVQIGEADGGAGNAFWRWMNQPLVQLPHFRHIPPALEKAAADF